MNSIGLLVLAGVVAVASGWSAARIWQRARKDRNRSNVHAQLVPLVALLALSGSYLVVRTLAALGLKDSSAVTLIPLGLFVLVVVVMVVAGSQWSLDVFRARRDATVLGTPPPRHVLPPTAVMFLILVLGGLVVIAAVLLTAPILEWWYRSANVTTAEANRLTDLWAQGGVIALAAVVPLALAGGAYQAWQRQSSANRLRNEALERRNRHE